MYFSWNYNLDDFLFENFNIHSIGICLLSILLVFALAFVNEAIRHVQKIISAKLTDNWLKSKGPAIESVNNEETPLVSAIRIPVSLDQVKRLRLQNHVLQSILYMINLFIGFVVMLISMDYYSGHFLAIIFGYGFGYYLLHISPDFNKSIAVNGVETDDGYYDREGDLGPRTSKGNGYHSLDDNHNSIVI